MLVWLRGARCQCSVLYLYCICVRGNSVVVKGFWGAWQRGKMRCCDIVLMPVTGVQVRVRVRVRVSSFVRVSRVRCLQATGEWEQEGEIQLPSPSRLTARQHHRSEVAAECWGGGARERRHYATAARLCCGQRSYVRRWSSGENWKDTEFR